MSEKGTDGREAQHVRLRGVADGLWVTVDSKAPAGTLREELTQIFSRLNNLAVDARVTIDTGGDDNCEALVADLGKFLKETFRVGSVKAPPRKRSEPEQKLRQKDLGLQWCNNRSDMLMLTGRIRSGQRVVAKNHLVVLGDVNPGAEVIASGDILIMGRLHGIAAAGQPNNDKAIVLALDFRPTQVQIGEHVAAGHNTGQSSDHTNTAEFAYIEDGRVVVADYLKAKPFGSMAWPQVR